MLKEIFFEHHDCGVIDNIQTGSPTPSNTYQITSELTPIGYLILGVLLGIAITGIIVAIIIKIKKNKKQK